MFVLWLKSGVHCMFYIRGWTFSDRIDVSKFRVMKSFLSNRKFLLVSIGMWHVNGHVSLEKGCQTFSRKSHKYKLIFP